MNTLGFLECVLPTSGNVVLGIPETASHGGTWWKHRSYDTAKEAAAAAVEADAKGDTVYFAVNTFNDWYTDETNKKVIRKQGNVAACRALYDDYDVKDKDGHYTTKAEAIAGIVAFAKALQLVPTIVDSGGGYHTYFHFDEDIDEQTWNELALL